MPTVRPFTGLRPSPNKAALVAAPPYDVLSSDEARELCRDNPLSFLRVNKPEVDFLQGQEPDKDWIAQRGKENLDRLVETKVMIRDSQPCFYIYRLTWKGKSQTGLVCLCSVEEYNKGLIKKHEHTRPDKVNDRASHMTTLKAQVGPVFSILRANPEVSLLLEELTDSSPVVDFIASDGVQHKLWRISAADNVKNIASVFAKSDAFYIADGHHRTEAAALVREQMRQKNSAHTGEEQYNYFLSVLFPDDQLRILSYNRVVRNIDSLGKDQLIQQLQERFDLETADIAVEPDQSNRFGMYFSGQWYCLSLDSQLENLPSAAENINAATLDRHLLRPILGINDIRTDRRIGFVGGIRGPQELVRMVDSGAWTAAFTLSPVTVDELLNVADAGEVMPPKSTWFEPKLRSGLVVHLFD